VNEYSLLQRKMANPEHLAKLKAGVTAWSEWIKVNQNILPDLSEVDLNGADLSGADLSMANFVSTDLSAALLRGADLDGAVLRKADLSSADLSGANLVEADFTAAILAGANFTGADLSGADLSAANLIEANLTDVNVTAVEYLRRDLDDTEKPSSLWRRLLIRLRRIRTGWRMRTIPIPYRRRMMRHRYQGNRGLSSCFGNRLFVRDAADQDYLDSIEIQLHNIWERFGFWCWGITDYGRSFLSVVVFASVLICAFGRIYSHWPGILNYGDRRPTSFTPYYFSIVTYTTLGFGDVKPNSLGGEILVSLEVILGYVTLGLLLAVLADKIVRRS
jgi:hypothetical protein